MNWARAGYLLEQAGYDVSTVHDSLTYSIRHIPGSVQTLEIRDGDVADADVEDALEAKKRHDIAEKLSDLNQNRPIQ